MPALQTMLSSLDPWATLLGVAGLIAPLFVSAVLLTLALYLLFEVFVPRPIVRPAVSSAPGPSAPVDPDLFGIAGRFSYLLTAAMFGAVLGMLAKLLGGFDAISDAASSDSIVGAIGSVVILVVGVAGSLFGDDLKINLQKPIGALALLVMFLVSGFYFEFLGSIG